MAIGRESINIAHKAVVKITEKAAELIHNSALEQIKLSDQVQWTQSIFHCIHSIWLWQLQVSNAISLFATDQKKKDAKKKFILQHS